MSSGVTRGSLDARSWYAAALHSFAVNAISMFVGSWQAWLSEYAEYTRWKCTTWMANQPSGFQRRRALLTKASEPRRLPWSPVTDVIFSNLPRQ